MLRGSSDSRAVRLLWLAVPATVAFLSVLGPAPFASAFPIYTDYELPNYATDPSSSYPPGRCITCHNNPNGGLGCEGVPISMYGSNVRPCLNPFGTAFQGNSHVWSAALASADSDGDGFSNGQELQEPTGSWAAPTPSPGHAAYVTRPGFANSTPGATDADHDGYCWAGQDMNADHDCLDASENTPAMDCDDGASAVHPGAPELCTNVGDDDCDGLDTVHDPDCATVVDADGDGYCPSGHDTNANGNCLDAGEQGGAVDCDDTNPNKSPARHENCTDGVDNDCDGLIDTTPGASDPNCTGDGDADADAYCPIGQDLNHDGDCLDASENTNVSDCDDYTASVNPGATEVCGNGVDDDCDGAIDFADASCAAYKDADHDGRCPGGRDLDGDHDCIDANETGVGVQIDCDDADPNRYEGAVEICTDDIDQDCDGKTNIDDSDCVGYTDIDLDHYCAAGIDLNNDHDCIDMDEPSGYGDCDETSATVNPAATERTQQSAMEAATCTDTIDNDCNGLADAADPSCVAYRDPDHDGYCATGHDTNADFDCDDASEAVAFASWPVDHAVDDGTIYPGAPENCIDYKDNDQNGLVDLADTAVCVSNVDADHDGYCPYGKDLDADGDCNDASENYRVSDCNDADPAFNPGVTEGLVNGMPTMNPNVCGDYRDNDCDGKVDLYDTGCFYVFDQDHDGFCGYGIDYTGDGDCLDPAEDEGGADCDDENAAVKPGATEVCDDHVDNDCDGFVDGADTSCGCHFDADCTDAAMCQVGRCVNNACVYEDDPSCKKGSGCAVRPDAEGGASWTLGAFGLVALAAVVVRRRRRSSR